MHKNILAVGITILILSVAVAPSSAFIINGNISTYNEFLLTPFTTRQIIEKPIGNIKLIENNDNKDNELNYQPFENIIPVKNHKNVIDYIGKSWILYPTDDTFIEKYYPDENHGSLNFFKVGWSSYGNYDYDSLLKFDLSSITSDKKVFAKLYLYYYDYYERGYEVDFNIYRVTSDWDEDNVTWNKQPSKVTISTDTLIVPWYPGVWLEFDVTEDVQGFIEGIYNNYGWLISDNDYCSSTERWIQFFSKENGNFTPYLVVKEPATIYVDDDNIEGPWNGTKEYPFQRIQDGIDNSFSGDTVYVYNGTYHESITIYIDKINLIGESKKDTIILSETERWAVLVRNRYYGITISGFTISTGSNNGKGYAGIVLDALSYDNYVTDNIIVNNKEGILLWVFANHNYILNNTIFFYHKQDTIIILLPIGIDLSDRNFGNIVSNNTIKDVNYGIYMGGESHYNSICYNDISNTNTGIYLNNLFPYNNISNNLLKNNYYGIYARLIGNNNSISRNTIIENEYGILIRGVYYSYIFENVIDSNSCGLFCTEGDGRVLENLHVYKNNFTNNKYEGGININCAKNCEVFCNNFINNKRNAKFLTYIGYRTKWYNNYWDDLKGSSYKIFGRMGLFIFHPFPWINIDWHPAKEPYDIGV